MTCFGCSSTGRERTRAATSSAVFHLANCPSRFCPAQTLVWIIFKNNCPERGLKIKMAPSAGDDKHQQKKVVAKRTDGLCCQIPFKCLVANMEVSVGKREEKLTRAYIVTRYTLVSSTNPVK